ncbi:Transposase [Caligus rogercresseyi]|uniref:Transposase n=1 Tax=Caligus rogercresseyi TaxID=217165 RepID=A0A7T8HKG7_CALRO|nr:Transposase [Caligus rogercresseyi]
MNQELNLPRSYFLIRIKLARTVNEIHGDLLSTFPDSCPGLSSLQRRHTEFDKGVFVLEKEIRPEKNVARVKHLVEDNPRITTRQVAAEVSLPSTTVSRLLTEDIGLRNLLSVLVLHQLSEANKTQRVKCCQDLLKLLQDHGEDFLGSHLLVQDDSWFYWDSAERRQVWAEPRGPVLDPPCETDSEEDDDSDGVHLQAEAGIDHCTTAGTTTDRNTMIEYLRTTGKRFLSLKKGQDPAERLSPHVGQCTDVEPVKQSPYSPDLNLCDRFLFRKLKHLLQEDEFGGHEEATLATRLRPTQEAPGTLHDVIAVRGNYVY